jgi:hypothetical protein
MDNLPQAELGGSATSTTPTLVLSADSVDTRSMTAKQESYLKSLLDTRVIDLLTLQVIGKPESLSCTQASEVIGHLRNLPYKVKESAPARVVAEGLESNIIYLVEGAFYRVKRSRATGRMYACVLDDAEGWVYDSAYIYLVKPEHKLTLEQASAYGLATGVCIQCSATLTDPKSIALGIGPVCAKKYR